jgi:hypothetical protein
MHILLFVAAAAAQFVDLRAHSPFHHSKRVLTTSGTLIGHTASNRSSVVEFLGIRYAEAPVEGLRFAAPKAYLAPEGTVFEASNWVSRS